MTDPLQPETLPNDYTEWLPKIEAAYNTIAEFLGRDNDLSASDQANMLGSPRRAAKAFMEMTMTKTAIKAVVDDVIKTGFPMEDSNATGQAGMITQGPISVLSLCPHHWLTVEYECFVSYIPKKGGQVLGLSKLARVAQALGKRPVLQEQLASDIADVLHTSERNTVGWPSIESEGSAVILVGHHSCMSCRGVKSHALTVTTELRGLYWQQDLENRFYNYVELTKTSKLR